VLAAEYYLEHEISVLRGTRAIAVEPQGRVVHTDRSGPIHYNKLLLATGARPVRFNVPGSALPGIHYLRTLDDARTIKHAAKTARHAVVVGGSFIGMKLSAALIQKGLHVTLLTGKQALFDKLEDPSICEYFHEIYSRRDIEIIVADTVAEFRGNGQLEAVVTQDGRTLPCDFAAVGIGVTPNVEFLQGSGITVEDGVRVDRYLKTDQPDIFAAGDVANFFDPVFNVRRRIEHWDNAVKQGRLAAKNMLDLRLPYDEVSYFACELFDVSFQFIGMADNAHERAQIGSLQAKSCAFLYLKNDVPRALFSTGRPAQETRSIASLIRYRTNLDWARARLSEPGFSLARFPSQTVMMLQGAARWEHSSAASFERWKRKQSIRISLRAYRSGPLTEPSLPPIRGMRLKPWTHSGTTFRFTLLIFPTRARGACCHRGKRWPSACRASSGRAGRLLNSAWNIPFPGPACTILRQSRNCCPSMSISVFSNPALSGFWSAQSMWKPPVSKSLTVMSTN
jgi:NADPH-dependent 2,4-dienoyl-CoA reductase/sulfur reductase-like enzyme